VEEDKKKLPRQMCVYWKSLVAACSAPHESYQMDIFSRSYQLKNLFAPMAAPHSDRARFQQRAPGAKQQSACFMDKPGRAQKEHRKVTPKLVKVHHGTWRLSWRLKTPRAELFLRHKHFIQLHWVVGGKRGLGALCVL
jgi:hypothetical protein